MLSGEGGVQFLHFSYFKHTTGCTNDHVPCISEQRLQRDCKPHYGACAFRGGDAVEEDGEPRGGVFAVLLHGAGGA